MWTQSEIYGRAYSRSARKLPRKRPEEELLDYVLLTEENRKGYVRLGHTLWVIEEDKKKPELFNVLNVLIILPPLKKGWGYIKNHPLSHGVMVFFIDEDEDRDEWARTYKEIIDYEIKNKRLYFKSDYPQIRWRYSERKL